MVLSRAALPLAEVVLEVRVAPSGLDDAFECGRGERRPPEVRVHDDAGGVQDAPQPWRPQHGELGVDPSAQVAGIDADPDLLAGPVDDGPRRVDRERVAGRSGELVHRRQVAKLHYVAARSASAMTCAQFFS